VSRIACQTREMLVEFGTQPQPTDRDEASEDVWPDDIVATAKG